MKLKQIQETESDMQYYIRYQNKVKDVLDKCVADGLAYCPLNFNMNSFNFDDLYDLISNILHDVGVYVQYLQNSGDFKFLNLKRLIFENLEYNSTNIDNGIITYDEIYALAWNVVHDILIHDDEWLTSESWDFQGY